MDCGVEWKEDKRVVGVVCTLQDRCNVVLLLSNIAFSESWMPLVVVDS